MKKKTRRLIEGIQSLVEESYPFLNKKEQSEIVENFIYNSMLNNLCETDETLKRHLYNTNWGTPIDIGDNPKLHNDLFHRHYNHKQQTFDTPMAIRRNAANMPKEKEDNLSPVAKKRYYDRRFKMADDRNDVRLSRIAQVLLAADPRPNTKNPITLRQWRKRINSKLADVMINSDVGGVYNNTTADVEKYLNYFK